MIAALDPAQLFRTLEQHGVRFVVVGDFAAALHGSPYVIALIDICHDRATAARLASALIALDAEPRDEASAVDAEALDTIACSRFSTSAGAFNCWATPLYDELAQHAVTLEVGDDLRIPVASVDDLLRIARAADTPKDRAVAEILTDLSHKRRHH